VLFCGVLHCFPCSSVFKNFYSPPIPNPQPASKAVRKQKNLVKRIFLVQYCHNLKNITPLEASKFNNLGIFQSLKLRILMEKVSDFSPAKFHSKYFGSQWAKVKNCL